MTLRRFSLPAVVLSALMTLAGCGGGDPEPSGESNSNRHEKHADSSKSSERPATSADVEFAQMMIPHHAQAIEMAEMVPEQGVSKELIQLAQDIEAAQQPEIDQLTTMLERWGAKVPAPETQQGEHGGHDGHGGHRDGDANSEMAGMMSDEDMDALDDATGAEFERMWLTMMVEHHEGAVSMSEAVLDEGEKVAARRLARQIIDAQDEEIGQMNRMLDGSKS